VNITYGKSTDGTPYITKADIVKLPLSIFLNHLPNQPSSQAKSPLRFSFAFKGDANKIMQFILPGKSYQ
jgi:hypothetical protein